MQTSVLQRWVRDGQPTGHSHSGGSVRLAARGGARLGEIQLNEA
jgi:hypothetical protein